MAAKTVLLFFAQALLIKCISSQCYGAAYNNFADGLGWGPANAMAWDAPAAWGSCAAPIPATWATAPMATTPYATAEWAIGFAPATLAASNGGGLAVTSASPIAPTGVAMTSDNAYEGALAVTGAIPFLGAVAVEGALPTLGGGAINYGCGNGNVAMVSEDLTAAGYNYPAPYGYGPEAGYGYAPYGYGPEFGYGYAPAATAYDAGLAGPFGYRGYGCGAMY